MNKVVLLGNRLFMKFPDLEYFRTRAAEANATIVSTEGYSEEQILTELQDAAAIVLIGHPVTAPMISAARQCRLIMTLSVGYDVVDVQAATPRAFPFPIVRSTAVKRLPSTQ